jgi:hypothetical protein
MPLGGTEKSLSGSLPPLRERLGPEERYRKVETFPSCMRSARALAGGSRLLYSDRFRLTQAHDTTASIVRSFVRRDFRTGEQTVYDLAYPPMVWLLGGDR